MKTLILGLLLAVSLPFSQAQGLWESFRAHEFEQVSGGKKSLMAILEAHKGKVVYIDFWASWCGPCMKEMRHSAKLAQDLAEENIVFVYLSVDANPKAWKKALSKLPTGKASEHYNRPIEELKGLSQALRLRSIPRYLLFDAQGQPLELDAYAPSEAECLPMLRAALKGEKYEP